MMNLIRFVLAGALQAGAVCSAFQSRSSGGYYVVPVRNKNNNVIFGGGITTTRLAASPAAAASVSIDENAQRDVRSMDEWAANCGVQRDDGFQLTAEDTANGVDYGVVTARDLPSGSPVAFIPSGMILSSGRIGEEFGDATRAGENNLEDELGCGHLIPLFRLFVKILAEYEAGGASPYYPWLNSLPRRFNNGGSMTFACFECLPAYAASLAMTEYQNLSNFGKAVKFVRLPKKTVKNKNLIKWAYNVAVTRSIEVGGDGGERVIVPVADMFNHGTETEVDINFDGEGNCLVYATKDVPAGSPLRRSYGDPTNPSPLFATYGFLDESSPATFCKLMHLRGEMSDLGMDYSNLLFYRDTGDISPEVWDILLYGILAEDWNLQRQFYQAYASGDEETKRGFHREYYPYTLEALKNHVDGFLTELDNLSAKASTKDPATHPRIPVILKHNEFVKETFWTVKSRLDAM